MTENRVMGEIKFQDPQESGLAKKDVYSVAEFIAKEIGYKPGSDIREVVSNLGGNLCYKNFLDLDESDSGSVVVRDEDDFDIYISVDTTVSRDRFTIAHELGHYFLHYLWHKQANHKQGPIKVGRYGSNRIEWEANWFAAAFLMPEKEFIKEFNNSGGDLFMLSNKFGVSTRAAEIRARALNLVQG